MSVKNYALNKGLAAVQEMSGDLVQKYDDNKITVDDYKTSVKIHLITKLLAANECIKDLVEQIEMEQMECLVNYDGETYDKLEDYIVQYEGINHVLGDSLTMIVRDILGKDVWKAILGQALLLAEDEE